MVDLVRIPAPTDHPDDLDLNQRATTELEQSIILPIKTVFVMKSVLDEVFGKYAASTAEKTTVQEDGENESKPI